MCGLGFRDCAVTNVDISDVSAELGVICMVSDCGKGLVALI